jgi:hypothetical protein
MVLRENIMAKQNKAGADREIWFHLYHILWVIGVIALFAFLDWWIALTIFGIIGLFFVWFS